MELKKKVLIIGDTVGWAIDRLIFPISERSNNIDIAYHYTDERVKDTGYNPKEGNLTHLTVELLEKPYDLIHLNANRATWSMLGNSIVMKAIGDKEIMLTLHNERDSQTYINKEKYERIDKFIAPTRFNQKLLGKKFPKVYHIPHTIEIGEFPYLEELQGGKVGYIGRIIPHKRYKTIVEASALVNKEVQGIGYVDDGDYWNEIRGMPNQKFEIRIQQDKMAEFIQSNFNIFINISEPEIESGPLGVLECAALGIPIMTTDIGWARDNLTSKEAYFIGDQTAQDPKRLGREIERFMANDKQKESMRRNARKLVEKYNMDWYLEEHIKIYNDFR